jgi:hypothetical protein
MKGKSLYAVCYVSGYTSEAEMQVFESRKDAEKEFDRLIRNTFGSYLDDIDSEGGWEEEGFSYPAILTKDTEELRQQYDIHIDDPFDITWDGHEVFERVYISELLIK